MRRRVLFPLWLFVTLSVGAQTLRTQDFGLLANHPEMDAAPVLSRMCDSARVLSQAGGKVTIRFQKGTYHFHPTQAAQRTYYISNHDQPNPKHVGVPLEHLQGVTLDGRGADLLFYGQMLPLSLVGSTDCTLKDFSIDFANPHIAQAEVVANDGQSITYRMAPWTQWSLHDGNLWTSGEGWRYHADYAIAFDGRTRHLVPGTSDLAVQTRRLERVIYNKVENAQPQPSAGDTVLAAVGWKDERLVPGTRLAMRTWDRPAPGLFLADDVRTHIRNVRVHYAEGMGLLAQMCQDIDLDGFSVCLRGKKDPRYFTTQADATHFSGCKGHISERNGLFEGMMDDAINVHGTYLKVIRRENDHTLVGQYMHGQSYGFRWGEVGDSVQFIQSNTMELTGDVNVIASIQPIDKPINQGVKTFRITFRHAIPHDVDPGHGTYGIENLTWTPSVVFENNVVRNNRARGSLFSTPRRVVVRRNLFDHTSGCAILLCGDCNGWFETGACRDVLIEKNRFVNALTNQFQFTNAVISIYPEIPDLAHQKNYFHSGIVIRDNRFDTFDHPLLYAKSVDGLQFVGNRVHFNTQFAPSHWNTHCFWLERVTNYTISGTKVTGRAEDVEQDLVH